jgi:membrane carboxypeptidase/penicillin-binding protein
VRAWAGGRDFSENQFDHVYLAKRPVGSTIKPFVYLTALDQSLNHYKVATATSILADEPMTIQNPGAPDWSPSNYDRQFRGDVTLRYALEHSLNLPTVYLAQRIGLAAVASTIERFHLAKQIPAVPSLVLGTAETSLIDLVASYGALANGGIYVQPRPFVSAIDQDGVTVATARISEERVATEAPVFVLTNLLQGVIERGTATRVRSLGYRAEVAGKTGTTDEARDAWFIGYTPDLVAGVWVGFDDNKRVGLTGGVAAVPIWTEFMQCASQFREPLPFIAPPGVSIIKIDSESGLAATTSCPPENIVEEIFVKGTEPSESCDLHESYEGTPMESQTASPPQTHSAPQVDEPRREKGLWDTLFQ